MGGSKRRVSGRGLGAVLKEQRAKLYIIRRCVLKRVGSDPSLVPGRGVVKGFKLVRKFKFAIWSNPQVKIKYPQTNLIR
ncbi:hypothetical protein YC2023_100818 [Brassica napus]